MIPLDGYNCGTDLDFNWFIVRQGRANPRKYQCNDFDSYEKKQEIKCKFSSSGIQASVSSYDTLVTWTMVLFRQPW